MFNKKLFLPPLILFQVASFVGCSDSKPNPEPIPEIIYPVDFRFITLNHKSNSSAGRQSVSYIKEDGGVVANYFFKANGREIPQDPISAMQIKDRLYITSRNNWGDNVVEVLDPDTFEELRQINLKNEIVAFDSQYLGGDSIVVVGGAKSGGYNVVIGALDPAQQFIRRTFTIDMYITTAKVASKKLFLGSDTDVSKLLVCDLDNISADGMREIGKDVALFSNGVDFITDKNNMIWTLIKPQKGSSAARLQSINPTTEEFGAGVDLPYSVSSYNGIGMAISPDGKMVYLRCHKAFYSFDVDNLVAASEPIFEYVGHVGVLQDLKMTKEGSLLFIDERQETDAPSIVYEYQSNASGVWKQLNNYSVGSRAQYIYISKY